MTEARLGDVKEILVPVILIKSVGVDFVEWVRLGEVEEVLVLVKSIGLDFAEGARSDMLGPLRLFVRRLAVVAGRLILGTFERLGWG